MKNWKSWLFLAILAGAFSVLIYGIKPGSGPVQILGEQEKIIIITPTGRHEAVAKIDTGADSSSIDREFARSIGLETRSQRKTIINVRGRQQRSTVEFTYVLGSQTITTLATVSDRTDLSTKVLIGRSDLSGFLLDPTKIFVTEPGDPGAPSSLSLFWRSAINKPGVELALIFPILGAVIVLFRLIVGIRTFGIFAPVVIALSLMNMETVQGLAVYAIFLVLGMIFKIAVLNRYQVFHVAELAVLMFFLSTVYVVGSIFFIDLSLNFASIFFPLIITAHLIEQASQSVEAHQIKETVPVLGATLGIALALSFLGSYLETFDVESLWVIFFLALASVLGAGRYGGLRLSEWARFKSLGKKHEPC